LRNKKYVKCYLSAVDSLSSFIDLDAHGEGEKKIGTAVVCSKYALASQALGAFPGRFC
jgi:hypothetical protein